MGRETLDWRSRRDAAGWDGRERFVVRVAVVRRGARVGSRRERTARSRGRRAGRGSKVTRDEMASCRVRRLVVVVVLLGCVLRVVRTARRGCPVRRCGRRVVNRTSRTSGRLTVPRGRSGRRGGSGRAHGRGPRRRVLFLVGQLCVYHVTLVRDFFARVQEGGGARQRQGTHPRPDRLRHRERILLSSSLKVSLFTAAMSANERCVPLRVENGRRWFPRPPARQATGPRPPVTQAGPAVSKEFPPTEPAPELQRALVGTCRQLDSPDSCWTRASEELTVVSLPIRGKRTSWPTTSSSHKRGPAWVRPSITGYKSLAVPCLGAQRVEEQQKEEGQLAAQQRRNDYEGLEKSGKRSRPRPREIGITRI